MKKTDVRDVTIRPGQENRMVGDVTSVSIGDTAKAGTDDGVGQVQPPATIGNPSMADGMEPSGDEYIPSTKDISLGKPGIGSSRPQPDCGTAPSTDTLQEVTGKKVGWPSTADGRSAGASKDGGQGLESTPITGSKQPFPPASDNSMKAKVVDSFIGPK